MHIADQLLQLLHPTPLTSTQLETQLGKNWDEDIKETMGFFIMWKWAQRDEGVDGLRRYSLTHGGREEFDRRVVAGRRKFAAIKAGNSKE